MVDYLIGGTNIYLYIIVVGIFGGVLLILLWWSRRKGCEINEKNNSI